MYNVSDGRLLASVDLPAYLSSGLADDDLSSSPSSSFCLLQVSADLSTAVAVAQSHAAIAVDLDHYFRSAFLLFCFCISGPVRIRRSAASQRDASSDHRGVKE